MQRWQVIADYTMQYPDPLRVRTGQVVMPGRRDDEWPGWVWCTDSGGVGGWLPERIVEADGTVREDFDTRELTVTAGQVVEGDEVEAGWVWCTDETGASGWVPERNLERV